MPSHQRCLRPLFPKLDLDTELRLGDLAHLFDIRVDVSSEFLPFNQTIFILRIVFIPLFKDLEGIAARKGR